MALGTSHYPRFISDVLNTASRTCLYLGLAVIIIGALVTVQIPKGGVTAGLERDLLILVSTLVMLAYGPGPFALDNAKA